MTVGDIVTSTDIGAYIGQYVELRPEGKELFGLCPFHHEDTPSFSVTPDKNQWYCFGCHKGGNILTFIAQYHKVKSAEAVKILCDYAGVSKDSLSGAQLNAILRSMRPKPFSTKKSTYIPLRDDVMEQYENNYEKLKVWVDEGIHPTVLENHQVRYDPADNRIVYPIVDMDGRIVAVCGRTLNPNYKKEKDRRGKPIRKYSYYQHIGTMDLLYGLYENLEYIQEKRQVIVFEGAKSVMKAESYGYDNAVALQTSHINPNQAKLLIRLQCDIVMALDSDVNIRNDPQIQLLQRYANVYWARNLRHLLGEKMAPVDAGKEVWEEIFANKIKLN